MNIVKRVSVRESASGARGSLINPGLRPGNADEGTKAGTIEAEFLAKGDEQERERKRQIADFSISATRTTDGDGEPDTSISTRDAYYSHQAALSRRPAGARGRLDEVRTDDDDGVSLPALGARDSWEQRELQRSRLPARGSR